MDKAIHPSLYQINTRLLLSRLSTTSKRAGLEDIPNEYWAWLKNRGIDYVWLMGIWNTNEIGFKVERQDWELVKYKSVLPDFTEEDLRGSPYAIDQYNVDPQMGNLKELAELKNMINQAGLRLILDFVPNHFGAHSTLIEKHPEIFIQGDENKMDKHPKIFFKHSSGYIFAHGKDPNFDPWMDTVQVNMAAPEAQDYMQKTLIDIANYCDGVRCDMAMLLQKHVFQRTWGHIISSESQEGWETPFWPLAIREIKEKYPDFVFIAECYWSMEQEMLDHGFDYTYDKALLDKMLAGNVEEMRWHLGADRKYQSRSVRFLENHDEKPVQLSMRQDKHFASAVLIAFMPGMRFYHFGQWEGRHIHVPVQLRRGPIEIECGCLVSSSLAEIIDRTSYKSISDIICPCTWSHYAVLLEKANHPLFKMGNWHFIEFESLGLEDETHQTLFGYYWKHLNEHKLVIVNYSDMVAAGKFSLENVEEPGLNLSSDSSFEIRLLPYQYYVSS